MATNHLALWKCHECSMTFTSPGLLSKHKGKFCPGNTVGRTSRIPDYSPRPESPEGDIPRRNPDPQLAQLAASHGRQMEMLQGKNKDLERQRDEIRRRLEELGRRPIREEEPSNNLLDELREQEARNQRLLDELRRQLADARQPINIIAEERYEQKAKPNLTYPIYYGSSLVAEISAIRQAYLQNGGNDPEVLAQLAQMLAEAQAIEDQLRNAPKQTKVVKEKKSTDYMQNLMALEMENERMQRELMLLQEQNMLARQRRKDDREGRMRYLWGTLRNFVHNDLYHSNRMISTARAITARGCCNSCSCSCSGSCSGSCCNSCCCSGRAHTSLGLYSLGASFPYGSIYGYSRLSPLYRDYEDDYIPRIPPYRPFRPWLFKKETETEVVEETVPEKPRIVMPFSVYPKIEKKKKESRIVESVVSGFRPGERLMKVYTRQEGEAGSGFMSSPLPRYSFNGSNGRVNTIYTYSRGGDGQTTSRSYSVGGIPHMWSASADPVSGYLSYFSPRDGFHKTLPYTSQYGYQNVIPLTGRSSYSAGTLALTSPRNFSKPLSLSRSYSNYPTSRSLAGTLDRYPLSQPLSYRSTPTTLLYRGEQIATENPPLVYRGEYVPLEKGPFVYRGEPIPTYSSNGYTTSGVKIVPVDRDQTSDKENKPEDKSKKGKTKKDDKKTKAQLQPKTNTQTQPTSNDPFVTNPQLAARFHAAGVALQAISRFREPGSVPPVSSTIPVIPKTAGSQAPQGQDPLATDPGLAARLQAATASLVQLREQNARQQAERARKEEEVEEKQSRKDEAREAEEKMKRDMAEARLKSTQRAVHFMTELNRKEDELYEERVKTRAAHAAEYKNEPGNSFRVFQPPPHTYKPPPEEKPNKSAMKKTKDTKKKSDKKK